MIEQALPQAILIGFAAWRIASMLADENGPANVFARLRALVGVPQVGEATGLLPGLFSCVWCLSLWLSVGAWATWEYWRPEPVIVVAAAAFAVALDRWVNSDG